MKTSILEIVMIWASHCNMFLVSFDDTPRDLVGDNANDEQRVFHMLTERLYISITLVTTFQRICLSKNSWKDRQS